MSNEAAVGRLSRLRRLMSNWGLGGFALAGFFVVSVVATGLGFADLRAANTDADQLSFAELAFVGAVTLFVVSAMVAALNAALDPGRGGAIRAVSAVFYVFFAFWSVGFGFGFFWKELAGQEFTEAQFSASITTASNSVAAASSALDTVETSVRQAAQLARARAELEAREGGACANRANSPPGDGPLTRSRFAFAERAEGLSQDVGTNWTDRLSPQQDMLQRRVSALSTGAADVRGLSPEAAAQLDQLANAGQLTPVAREALFAAVYDAVRGFVAEANTLRRQNAEPYAARLDALAQEVGPDPSRPGRADPARADDLSYCWDVVLHERLAAAAAALRRLEDIQTPVFEFLEGPKATRAAFFNLARFAGGGWRSGEAGFGEKEFVALFASLAVDLGILILTLLQAPARARKSLAVRAFESADDARETAARLLGVAPSRMRSLLARYIVDDRGARFLVTPMETSAEFSALRDLALMRADAGGVRLLPKRGLRVFRRRHKRLARRVGATGEVRLYRLAPEAEIALKLLFEPKSGPRRPPPPAPMRLDGLAD